MVNIGRKQKKPQFFIDKISSTKQVKACPCLLGENLEGDIAYSMFLKLVPDVPSMLILRDIGYSSYDEFFIDKPRSRNLLSRKLSEWYAINKNNLVWVDDYSLYRNQKLNPIGGCYRLKNLNLHSLENRCL